MPDEPLELPWRKHAALYKQLADTAPDEFQRQQALRTHQRFLKYAKEQDERADNRKRIRER